MVDNYIGKTETGKRSRAVSREIAPTVSKLYAEDGPAKLHKGVITRKKGGR